MRISRFTPSLALAFALLLPVGCAGLDSAPTEGAVTAYDAETFLRDDVDVRRVLLRGRLFAPRDERRERRLQRLPALARDRGAHSLTDSTTTAVIARGFFPNDDRFLYSADSNGDELNHLYVRETDGTVVDLTPGEGLKARMLGWSGRRGVALRPHQRAGPEVLRPVPLPGRRRRRRQRLGGRPRGLSP